MISLALAGQWSGRDWVSAPSMARRWLSRASWSVCSDTPQCALGSLRWIDQYARGTRVKKFDPASTARATAPLPSPWSAAPMGALVLRFEIPFHAMSEVAGRTDDLQQVGRIYVL